MQDVAGSHNTLYNSNMTARHKILIKVMYADPANSIEAIADTLGLAVPVVEETIRVSGYTRLSVNNTETPVERLRRREIEKQEAFYGIYGTLEATIIDRLTQMAEEAESADDLGKIARAYRDIRTCGLPAHLVDAAVAGSGVSVQILNSL